MSVRVGDRGEGKLQVLNKARELKMYSLTTLKSDKRFPKSTRWLYAYPIAEEVRSASISIRRANSVYATTEEEWRYRRLEQVKAHASLNALLDLIDDAYDAGYVTGSQVEYWTGLILKTDDLLKAWMKSDKRTREKTLDK
jgi:hypothetical protein